MKILKRAKIAGFHVVSKCVYCGSLLDVDYGDIRGKVWFENKPQHATYICPVCMQENELSKSAYKDYITAFNMNHDVNSIKIQDDTAIIYGRKFKRVSYD